ncbi:MAG: helix-turn-helix transcriptional regulator [Magnetococcales bacterium]|nr:helix-turn-helix transcriptional regulator [Magnetococcales bacterium]
METLSDRLRATRKERNLSQKALAEAAGVPQSTIGSLESGRTESSKRLAEIATALDVTPEWLLHGDQAAMGEYALIPRHSIRAYADASIGTQSDDTKGKVVDHLAFKREWLRRNYLHVSDMASLVVEGDSMEPTLLEGDTILIDKSQADRVIDGKIYVVYWDGAVRVKRLQKLPGGRLLCSSDNPIVQPFEFFPDNGDDIQIIGRVIWFGRML